MIQRRSFVASVVGLLCFPWRRKQQSAHTRHSWPPLPSDSLGAAHEAGLGFSIAFLTDENEATLVATRYFPQDERGLIRMRRTWSCEELAAMRRSGNELEEVFAWLLETMSDEEIDRVLKLTDKRIKNEA